MEMTRLLVAAAAALLWSSIAEADDRPTAGVDTLKSRLSDKASDEQRVDNCKVTPERRGSKERPGCISERKEDQPRGQAASSRPEGSTPAPK
jgi:hypothetical protein